MSFRYPAGVVGAAVTPSGPYQTSTAPGIWSLAGQANFQAQSLWPTQGSVQGYSLYGWGANSFGQLGLGNTTDYSSPKQVGALTSWLKMSAGYYHCAVIKNDGTLWTWGRNNSGQLGLGNTTNYSSPKQVGSLTTWSQIYCGANFCAAITTTGQLWTWGDNNQGQLGLGNTTFFSSPKQVGALTTWSKLPNTQGGDNRGTGAITTTGQLYVWGSGIFGGLRAWQHH
mgnify:CR=1 FL=1